jgi:hypothetical protein
MSNVGGTPRHSFPWSYPVSLGALLFALVVLAVPLHAQQTDVARFDAFVGYTFLDSPHVNLFENGIGGQFGVRPKTWLTVGVDYTFTRGPLTLTPNLLQPSLQAALGQELQQLGAAGVPIPGAIVIPAHSVTQTIAAGPELVYRHMKHVTLFFRPIFLGMIHEAATPKPDPTVPVEGFIVEGFQSLGLVPASGTKTDNVLFYGFGGGFDILFSRHLAWRTQADMVYDHLFSDLLKDGRLTARFSVGPCFNFGKNISEK